MLDFECCRLFIHVRMITAEHMGSRSEARATRLGLLTIQSMIGEEAPALNVDLLYLLFFSALAD